MSCNCKLHSQQPQLATDVGLTTRNIGSTLMEGTKHEKEVNFVARIANHFEKEAGTLSYLK